MRTLESPRLILRPLQADDEPFYCHLYTDPETMRHIGATWSPEESRQAFQKALARTGDPQDDHRYWTISQRPNGQKIGLIGWHRLPVEHPERRSGEIGAILISEAQGIGVSIEAGQALMAYAFSENLFEELRTEHAIDHLHAATMMSRLGFERQECTGDDPLKVRWHMTKDRWTSLQIRSAKG